MKVTRNKNEQLGYDITVCDR